MEKIPNQQELLLPSPNSATSYLESVTTLFLSSLHNEISQQDISQHFNQFGKVVSIKINKKGSPSKMCTAIMRMETEEGLDKLISQKSQLIRGYEIFVEKKLTGKDLVLKNVDIGVRRIHISNIPAHITGKDLFRLFSEFGKVEMAYSKQQKDSKDAQDSRLYGFVTFYEAEDALNLLDLKSVKFEEIKEPLEIKSFNKKSTKLTLDYFNKNQEQVKVKADTKKAKKKSKKRQRRDTKEQADIQAQPVETRDNSPVEVIPVLEN
jgi:RNA recognition motif-containing protein